jgi:hypothetical protein
MLPLLLLLLPLLLPLLLLLFACACVRVRARARVCRRPHRPPLCRSSRSLEEAEAARARPVNGGGIDYRQPPGRWCPS